MNKRPEDDQGDVAPSRVSRIDRRRAALAVASRQPASSLIFKMEIPPGAVVLEAPPALFSPVVARHLAMTEEQARTALDDMRRDPAYRAHVVVLQRRPLVLAAPPDVVAHFLLARRSSLASVKTVTAEPQERTKEEEADDLLREIEASVTAEDAEKGSR